MQHVYVTSPGSPRGRSVDRGASGFAVICILHSLIAIFSGGLMMFHANGIYSLSHGIDTAAKLVGSTPKDQLLIRTSDSFAGLLLLAIGLLLLMVSGIRDREFQAFFAKGCTVLHVLVATWRISVERRVEDLAWDCVRLTVADILLALSWVMFVVCNWREKYD